jgi:hypothetical protein
VLHFTLGLFSQRSSAMQVIATTAAATATAVASSVGYAQPVHIQTQHFDAPQAGMEMNQMTSRPNQPAGIVQNIKHIFDHDLLLENDFYAEANVKTIFSPTCKIRFLSRTLPSGRTGAVVLSDPQPVVRGASKACGNTLGRQRSHARTKNTGASPRRTMARNSQRRL